MEKLETFWLKQVGNATAPHFLSQHSRHSITDGFTVAVSVDRHDREGQKNSKHETVDRRDGG